MNQRRLHAYLEIIQELLTCPRGEEWIRLKQHEDLVDAELVQIMEHVASQLLQEGNQQAATFLHNWAAKLHHILIKETQPDEKDTSQLYLSFIQTLLDAPEAEKEKLLSKNRDLIGPGLVQTMKQVAHQFQEQGADAPAAYLSNLATELNQAWIEAHEFEPKLDKAADPAPQTVIPSDPQQPLTEAIHEMTQVLHQLQQTLTHQRPNNPIWYMEVLERAATAQWLLTTEEIEQLIGVRPKCHGKDKTYQRGTWTFVKTGKLGAQTAWRVTKTPLEALPLEMVNRDSLINRRNVQDRTVNASKTAVSAESLASKSLAKHPQLRREVLNNGVDQPSTSLEIPEMEDVWA